MRLIGLAVTLVLSLNLAPLAAEGQSPTRVYRMGFLAATNSPHLSEAFRQGLRDFGWIEGQNIIIEYRDAGGRLERLPDLAAQLVSLNVDLIVAQAGPETAAAKQATTTIPIVFLVHGDPVGGGHVASLAKPGGNVTGTGGFFPELAAKRLELLKQTLRGLSRVAVLWNAANPIKHLDWKATQAAGQALALTIQSRELRSEDDFPGVFNAVRRERPEALLVIEDPVMFHRRTLIVEFAARERMPAIYALREFAEAGGLMTYGVDLTDLFRRGAAQADKILRGAKPADLPVQHPTKFELVINLKTAKALGLMIPPSLLLRADQVIE
jgi:putative tryptophan/tyrosine transport system substrate-binding protein